MGWRFTKSDGSVKRSVVQSVKRPSAKVRLTASHALSAGSGVPIPWDGTVWDTDGFWNAANPTRLTAPYTGRYRLTFNMYGNGATNSVSQITFFINGSAAPDNEDGVVWLVQSSQETMSYTTIVNLNAGDYVEMRSYCNNAHSALVGTTGMIEYLSDVLAQPIPYPNNFIGQLLAYTDILSTMTVTSGSTAAPSTGGPDWTTPAFAADGVMKVRVEAFVPRVDSPGGTNVATGFVLQRSSDGGATWTTIRHRWGEQVPDTGIQRGAGMSVAYDTPPAGSTKYRVGGFVNPSGSGALAAGSNNTTLNTFSTGSIAVTRVS